MVTFPRFNRRKADICSHEFVDDERVPYKATTIAGHKIEEWREACKHCGTWIWAHRTDGVMD